MHPAGVPGGMPTGYYGQNHGKSPYMPLTLACFAADSHVMNTFSVRDISFTQLPNRTWIQSFFSSTVCTLIVDIWLYLFVYLRVHLLCVQSMTSHWNMSGPVSHAPVVPPTTTATTSSSSSSSSSSSRSKHHHSNLQVGVHAPPLQPAGGCACSV